jgi:hypothetical protein
MTKRGERAFALVTGSMILIGIAAAGYLAWVMP